MATRCGWKVPQLGKHVASLILYLKWLDFMFHLSDAAVSICSKQSAAHSSEAHVVRGVSFSRVIRSFSGDAPDCPLVRRLPLNDEVVDGHE